MRQQLRSKEAGRVATWRNGGKATFRQDEEEEEEEGIVGVLQQAAKSTKSVQTQAERRGLRGSVPAEGDEEILHQRSRTADLLG